MERARVCQSINQRLRQGTQCGSVPARVGNASRMDEVQVRRLTTTAQLRYEEKSKFQIRYLLMAWSALRRVTSCVRSPTEGAWAARNRRGSREWPFFNNR